MDKNEFSRRQFLKRGLTLTGSSVALGAVESASAATSNSIVTENKLTGTAQSQWDLSGEGQYSGFGLGNGQTPLAGVTNYIEGFADNMSVNHGQTINFKINTNCKNYRIDIYRLGYYAGLGARKITTISMTAASVQPTPLTNLPIGLVDAGNWSVTASWAVPATAVSGVYIAHLVRQDTVAGENHITFVVRDDNTQHDIVFQTSDLTWQAYNGWGGYNLYGGSGLSTTSNGRAYKVSYNRPVATRDEIGIVSGSQDFVFGAEVCAIRWLEANGYDVCYISGVDSDRNGSQLLNHKV
ncbi:MAG TPA: N,N-dimethylformamidase beta subunit family domain-containing protein, partial [Chthoniobacterales bacterium]